jgi:large subunit ribosomal protein L21
MHAIIQTGGKQYRVAPGDVVRVETIKGFEPGTEILFQGVLAVVDQDRLTTGGTVKAKILGEGRAKKILVFKFKRKKQYKRTIGHRQNYTEIQIGEIAHGA